MKAGSARVPNRSFDTIWRFLPVCFGHTPKWRLARRGGSMWDKNQGSGNNSPNRKNPDEKKKQRQFLDNHPSRQPNMDRSVDRSIFDVYGGASALDEREAALSKQILVYHESQPADTGNDWMYKLKEDSMQYLAEQRGVHLQQIYRESIYKKGLETLIDKIYGLLQRFTWEFNQVAGGTELHVSSTISGDVTEVTRYNKLREAMETETYFRARLTTRYMSLIVRGKDDAVDFFLVPTNKVMALSRTESEYKSMARIQVKITADGMMWRMENGVPPIDSLDELCMWLFSRLVAETKEAARADAEENASGA
jgi:hypothetical protein